MIDVPILRTQRLVLRALTLDDAPGVVAHMNSPNVAQYVPGPPYPYELEHAYGYIEGLAQKPDRIEWGILLDDVVIGGINLHDIKPENGTCLVGYLLGEAYWGKGYASEALAAVLRYAFETLGVRRVGAEVFEGNTGSLRVLEKAGFKREGLRREARTNRGIVYDEHVLGLLASDWKN